jgi:hypothetical protein
MRERGSIARKWPVPSQRTNKFCAHGHYRDRSAAEAIFAKGTYFVDMPRTFSFHSNFIK